MTIYFGSEQAEAQRAHDERVRLLAEQEYCLERAVEIAEKAGQSGKELADWFLEAIIMVDFGDINGVAESIMAYALENGTMPDSYYRLVNFQESVKEALGKYDDPTPVEEEQQ